jgi:carbon-monoxide dehydrogenase medium subunit
VKPPPFEYHLPDTLDEALAVLREEGPDAKPLAGGQSLVPMMNLRLAWPPVLVDLNRVDELHGIRVERGLLCVRAMVRQRELERSTLARERCPLLVEALGFVGHPATRARGTIAGSIAHADPAAEIPTVLMALEGEVVVDGPSGRRVVPASELFLGYFSVALEPGELIVEVRFPVAPESRSGHAFEEFARRFGDFALAGVAAGVELNGDGGPADVRLALCGAASRPVRARRAEEAALDGGLTAEGVVAAARVAADEADPPSDMHGDAGYRRELVASLTERALTRALARAREAGP